MPAPFLIKHIRLVRSYVRISFKKSTEYKFNVFTNALGYFSVMVAWIFFWDFLFGNIKELGEWKYPMLLLMIGFLYLSDALWQIFWYTISFSSDIVKGNLDLYLVRPIHPLYALVMKELQLFSLIPAMFGIVLIVYTLTKYYAIAVVNFSIALLMCAVAAALLGVFYSIIMSLAFWLGKISAIRTVFRSFQIMQRYPLDIFSMAVRGFFTFVVPLYFFGTAQVLAVLGSKSTAAGYLMLEVVVFVFWLFVWHMTWSRGVRRYESYGG